MKDGRAALGCLLACTTGLTAWATWAPAWTAEIRLESAATGSLTFTDNIDLVPDDQKEAGLITEIGSLNRLRVTGPRLNADADINLFLDHFSNDNSVDVRSDSFGFGTLEVLNDLLFIDAEGSWQQQLVSPEGRYSGAGLNRRGDTTDVQTIGISPYLVGRFDGWAEGELRYRYDRFFTDTEDIGDSTRNQESLTLRTGNRFTRLLLTGLAENFVLDSERDVDDLRRQTLELTGEYAVIRQVSLLGMVGYERFRTNSLSDDPDGPIWYAGFRLRPSPRSELSFTYGQRYGGDTIGADARYDITPTLTLRASISDSIDTPQERIIEDQLNLAVDPQGNLINTVTGLPVRPGDVGLGLRSGVSRTRTYQASLFGTRGRDTYQLSVIDQERSFDIGPDETVLGMDAGWDRRLSPVLTAGLRFGYRNTETQGVDGSEDTVVGRLDVSYALTANALLSASYARTDRFADNPQNEYTENAVVIGARVEF